MVRKNSSVSLAAGANPNVQERYTGKTALYIAAEKGDSAKCSVLLRANSDVKVMAEDGSCR